MWQHWAHTPSKRRLHTSNRPCTSMRSLLMTWAFCWQMQQICRHKTQRQKRGWWLAGMQWIRRLWNTDEGLAPQNATIAH